MKIDAQLQLILSAIKGLDIRVGSIESGQKKLLQDFALQQKDITGLRTDFATQQTDITGLRADFALQQKEISGMRTELKGVHVELRQQAVRQESMDHKLSLIVEAVSPQFEEQTELKDRVDGRDQALGIHDLRLRKLEQ